MVARYLLHKSRRKTAKQDKLHLLTYLTWVYFTIGIVHVETRTVMLSFIHIMDSVHVIDRCG